MFRFLLSSEINDLRPIGHYVFYVILFALISVILTTRDRVRVAIWALTLAGVIAAAWVVAEGGAHIPGLEGGTKFTGMEFSSRSQVVVRMTGTFIDANLLGSLLCFTVPLGLACWQAARGSRKVILVFLIAMMFAAAAGTYSRGAFVAILVGGIVPFVFLQRQTRLRVAMAVALGASVAVAWVVIDFAKTKLFSSELVVERAMAFGPGVMQRYEASRQIIQAFYDHPLIGVGPGLSIANWSVYVPDAATSWNMVNSRMVPHNIFLDVLVGTGVLGLVPFLMVVLSGLRLAWRNVRTSQGDDLPWNLGIFAAFTATLVNGLSLSTLSYPYLWTSLGLIAVSDTIRRGRSPLFSPQSPTKGLALSVM